MLFPLLFNRFAYWHLGAGGAIKAGSEVGIPLTCRKQRALHVNLRMSFNAEVAAGQGPNRTERGIHSAASRGRPSSTREALPLRGCPVRNEHEFRPPKSWMALIV